MSNSFQFQMFHAPCYLPGKVVQLFRVYCSARWKRFQKTSVVVGYDVGGRRVRRTMKTKWAVYNSMMVYTTKYDMMLYVPG